MSKFPAAICVMGFLGFALLSAHLARSNESAVAIPAAVTDNPKAAGPLQTAVLAGGCFWGVQGVYQHVAGVKKVVAGYAGGGQTTAHYEVVGSGITGHAESVQIQFDPQQITYGEILRIYFSVAHDPTLRNRQGPDSGTQYRSAIFPVDDTQKNIALRYIAQLDQAHLYGSPIATVVETNKGFYPAEAYHQDYLENNPRQPYIVINDLPKVHNLQRMFPDLYRDKPVLVADTRAAR